MPNNAEKAATALKLSIQNAYNLEEALTCELTAAAITAVLLLEMRGLGRASSEEHYSFEGKRVKDALPDAAFLDLYLPVHTLSPYAANALFQELLLRELVPHLTGVLKGGGPSYVQYPQPTSS